MPPLERETDVYDRLVLNLFSSPSSPFFMMKTLLPSADCSSTEVVKSAASSSLTSKGTGNKVYAHQMVRTDAREQKLDAFLQPVNKSLSTGPDAVTSGSSSELCDGKARQQEAEMEDFSKFNTTAVAQGDAAVPPEELKETGRLSPETMPPR